MPEERLGVSEPEELEFMIGTRTLKEDEAVALSARACLGDLTPEA